MTKRRKTAGNAATKTSKKKQKPDFLLAFHTALQEKEYLLDTQMPCLAKLRNSWAQTPPFKEQNVKILINIHLDDATLGVIYALLVAGAQVDVTVTKNTLSEDASIRDFIKTYSKLSDGKLNYFLEDEITQNKKNGYYNVFMNCGDNSLLRSMKTTHGIIELTHTEAYKEMKTKHEEWGMLVCHIGDLPIVKTTETTLGTGDGILNVVLKGWERERIQFLERTKKNSTQWINPQSSDPQQSNFLILFDTLTKLYQDDMKTDSVDFVSRIFLTFLTQLYVPSYTNAQRERKWIVFGYGQVGFGVVLHLLKTGVNKANIVVVDTDEHKCKKARDRGLNWVHFDLSSESSREKASDELKEHFQDTHYIVTATGVEGFFSKYFKMTDIDVGDCDLHIFETLPESNLAHYNDTYIWATKEEKLYIIEEGRAEALHLTVAVYFKELSTEPVISPLSLSSEIIQEYITKKGGRHIHQKITLYNVSTTNDFGAEIPKHRIYNQGMLANFCQEDNGGVPTKREFLDTSFTALVKAVQYLLQKQLLQINSCEGKFPEKEAIEILKEWLSHYPQHYKDLEGVFSDQVYQEINPGIDVAYSAFHPVTFFINGRMPQSPPSSPEFTIPGSPFRERSPSPSNLSKN